MKCKVILSLLAITGCLFAQDRGVQEQIQVKRIILEARVIDNHGQPIEGLALEDFELTSRRKPIPLLSLEWVDELNPPPVRGQGEFFDPEETNSESEFTVNDPFWDDIPAEANQDPGGRLIIFFVQKDLEPGRMYGTMKLMHFTEEIIENLVETDYVAVVSFEKHLKIHLDFTRSHDLVETALAKTLKTFEVREPRPGPFPSLARRITPNEAYRTSDAEEALLQVADALETIGGTKTIIFIGYGLGVYDARSGDFNMRGHYPMVLDALQASKTSVFTLDVSPADFHSLEFGLQQAASDTGGMYYRTKDFPAQAIGKLLNTISGHYVLTFEEPTPKRKNFKYKVKVKRRNADILVRSPFNAVRYGN